MKRTVILGCLTAMLGLSCSHLGQNEVRSSSPRAPEIQKALNQTVIPEAVLDNVKIDEALQFWSRESQEHHPLRFEFRYLISYPMTYSMTPARPGETSRMVPSTVTPSAARVNVRRKNITSARLLDEICRQANFSWTILGRVIVVKPRPVTSETQS